MPDEWFAAWHPDDRTWIEALTGADIPRARRARSHTFLVRDNVSGGDLDRLLAQIDSVSPQPGAVILLDLGKVHRLSITAQGMLVDRAAAFRAQGGTFVLCCCSEELRLYAQSVDTIGLGFFSRVASVGGATSTDPGEPDPAGLR